MYHAPPSVLAHFTAAVHQTAIERRKRNSTQGTHAPPLSFDPDTFLSACMTLFARSLRSAKSTHFLAEREENRLKIHYYNWTPKISPLDKWQHDWIASGVFEEGANSSRHALRCLVPSTLQQLLGAFSSPRQINSISIPGSPGIDIGTVPYCHRLLLRLNPLTPNTTCPVAPMQMQTPPTHQPHYHYHAAPPIPRRLPRPAPYPILISPSFLACSEYLPGDTYATRTHKPNCNRYRPTPHPRRLLPTCLTPTC